MKCSICGKIVDQWYEDEKGRIFCSEKCFEKTYPTCCICGKPMKNWIEANNKKYCSDLCYQKILPKCASCGRPMKKWVESQGKKYCSDACYQKSWPKCASCGKPMKKWIESQGKKYCNETCFSKSWPKCNICGKPMKSWIESNGKKYCGETCFEISLPKCDVCGKPVNGGIIDKNTQKIYCNNTCYERILPNCSVCGKKMHRWIETKEGKKFCSESCLEKILPTCRCCGKPMKNWIEYSKSGKFCNNSCYQKYHNKSTIQIDINAPLTSKELAYITGLTQNECLDIMQKNGIDGDAAFIMIDTYMQSLSSGIEPPIPILSGVKNAGVHIKLAQNLSNYTTARGGIYGYKGFVFEQLHAANASAKGRNISVLDNNGPADLIEIDSSGKQIFYQTKSVQKPNGKTFDDRYEGMTIVADKGNTTLLQKAREQGFKAVESDISNKELIAVARLQQWESQLLKTEKAPITANLVSAHYAGFESMKFAAKIGAGFNIGSNVYDLLNGNKDLGEATIDTLFETGKIAVTAYASGGVITLAGSIVSTATSKIAETAVGGIVAEKVAMVGTAVADSAVGEFVVGCVDVIVKVATSISSAPIVPVIGAAALVGFGWRALSDD